MSLQEADMSTKPESSGGLFLKIESGKGVTLRFFDKIYGPYDKSFTAKDGTVTVTKNRYAGLVLVRGSDPEVKVFEFGPQIQGNLVDLHEEEAWGDLKTFDVKISKSGSGLETKYTVVALPKSELKTAEKAAIASHSVDIAKALKTSPSTDPEMTTSYDLLLTLLTEYSIPVPTAAPKLWLEYVAKITDEPILDAISKVSEEFWGQCASNFAKKIAADPKWRPPFLADFDPFEGQ